MCNGLEEGIPVPITRNAMFPDSEISFNVNDLEPFDSEIGRLTKTVKWLLDAEVDQLSAFLDELKVFAHGNEGNVEHVAIFGFCDDRQEKGKLANSLGSSLDGKNAKLWTKFCIQEQTI
jgi:hypothetical protein